MCATFTYSGIATACEEIEHVNLRVVFLIIMMNRDGILPVNLQYIFFLVLRKSTVNQITDNLQQRTVQMFVL